MSETLTPQERAELRYLARQRYPLWGVVYDRGGDPDINRWLAAGLIEAVEGPVVHGRLTCKGGYRITPAGRLALKEHPTHD